MIKYEVTNTFVTGVFPDTVADNSSGAATPDGFEFVKAYLDNANLGPLQAIMDYSAGSANVPTGSVGVPNGVTESAGASQIVEALHKMTGSGPGTMKPYYKNDLPAVTGDRVLLLAEQGVLIASYPDLDDATWITGNTAAQIAAAAAGKKFYRSSDAAGTTGDAAGPWLQLPANLNPTFLKMYVGDATGTLDFTVAGGPGWSAIRVLVIPWQNSDGSWFAFISSQGTLTTTTSSSLTFTGLTFKNIASWDQSGVSVGGAHGVTPRNTSVVPNTGVMSFFYATTTTEMSASGIFELNSKPTWADDFEIQWGITY